MCAGMERDGQRRCMDLAVLWMWALGGLVAPRSLPTELGGQAGGDRWALLSDGRSVLCLWSVPKLVSRRA